jgi:hypothetical protein
MRRIAFTVFAVVACNDAPAPPNLGTTSSDPESTTQPDATTDSGSAGTADTSTTGQPAEVVLQLELELEALEEARLEITRVGDELTATLQLSRGYGVVPDGATITGSARIDALPEAGATIYTARLGGPVVEGGPCGAEPVSLALALHHDDDAAFVAGGVTPYCGADAWWGVPPIEPLRISGKMP